jgi:hypothetical protein
MTASRLLKDDGEYPEDQGGGNQHDDDVHQEADARAEDLPYGREEHDAREEKGIARQVDQVDCGRERRLTEKNLRDPPAEASRRSAQPRRAEEEPADQLTGSARSRAAVRKRTAAAAAPSRGRSRSLTRARGPWLSMTVRMTT